MDTTHILRSGRPPGPLLDGRYRLTASIAHGGMATVYLGVDTRLDRTVAIKIMHAELAADEDFVARFIREARSIARLSHQNVVAVYDQGSDGQHLYLAMEHVRGRTLRQLLTERGRLSPRESLDIIEGVLAGLAAAHQAGIVHRDVKPENVLLAEDGRVKVADFGLARSMGGTSHTKTGVLMGTVAYLAPEQVTASSSDTRCDVYAAGVMLFELLTGQQPHTGESALAVAYKHVNETIPPPSAVLPGLPLALDALVALATSRDPQRRPADAGQFLQAVRQVRGGQPLPWPPRATQPLAPGPPSRPGWAGGPPPGYPPAAAAPQGAAMYPPGSPGPPGHQTLIVNTAGSRGREARPAEPRLQRWLFSRGMAGLLAVLVVLALAAGLAWWQLDGRYTHVPKVTGQSVTAAGAELRGMGFTVRTGPARLDNAVARGEVIATLPAASARVRRGATIELIPSAGPHVVTVPSVSGQPLAGARAALRHAGLTPGAVTYQASATVPAGVVIATSPAAGTSWPQPRPVAITVSAGPPLPNLVGQQQSAAQAWAAANGVTLNVLPAPANTTAPQGVITRQAPAANTPLTKGEVVTIYVSPGPPSVQIPNVTGLSFPQAASELRQLGFQVNLQRVGFFGNKVFDYSPQGQAPKGSTITLWWGLLPSPLALGG